MLLIYLSLRSYKGTNNNMIYIISYYILYMILYLHINIFYYIFASKLINFINKRGGVMNYLRVKRKEIYAIVNDCNY